MHLPVGCILFSAWCFPFEHVCESEPRTHKSIMRPSVTGSPYNCQCYTRKCGKKAYFLGIPLVYTIFVSQMNSKKEQRKIIHIDMDAFFASVEQRDHPEWRGKPLAVGHDVSRGVVATASYEARAYGIHSAMSIQMAKRLCPDLIIAPGRHEIYQEVSAEIHRIFHDYTDQIEPISLDEAFLDVTRNKKNIELAVDIAREIKQRIKDELHLTASAGISYNKFLAKIASDYRKPDGLFVIHPERALDFICTLPIEDFWGVGSKTAERMHHMGIFTGEQLRSVPLNHLLEVFGKAGRTFYDFARGIDERPVVAERVRKSVGCERTFMQDISLRSSVIIELYHVTIELLERLQATDFKGRTLTLKVRYADFTTVTRSITQAKVLRTKDDILPLAKNLMSRIDYGANHSIRLIGLSVVNPHAGESREKEHWLQLDLDF